MNKMGARELAVETYFCFLCSETLPTTSPDCSGSFTSDVENKTLSDNNGVCLQSICRYLKINPYSVAMKSWKEFVANDFRDTKMTGHITPLPDISPKCYFSVTLCKLCQPVTEKLMSFIREVEVTQMLIKDQLDAFHQILEVSEKKNFDHLNSQKTAETKLVENLRKETKNKCFRQLEALSSLSAKVVVSRFDDKDKVMGSFSQRGALPPSPKCNETAAIIATAKEEVIYIPPPLPPLINDEVTVKQELFHISPLISSYESFQQSPFDNHDQKLFVCNTSGCKRKFAFRRNWRKHIVVCYPNIKSRRMKLVQNPVNKNKQHQQKNFEEANQQAFRSINYDMPSFQHAAELMDEGNSESAAVQQRMSAAASLLNEFVNVNDGRESTLTIHEQEMNKKLVQLHQCSNRIPTAVPLLPQEMNTKGSKTWKLKCEQGCGRYLKLMSTFIKHKISGCPTLKNKSNTTKNKGYKRIQSAAVLAAPTAERPQSLQSSHLNTTNLQQTAASTNNENNLEFPSSSNQNYSNNATFSQSSMSTLQQPNPHPYIPPVGSSESGNWSSTSTTNPCNVQTPPIQSQAMNVSTPTYVDFFNNFDNPQFANYSIPTRHSDAVEKPVLNTMTNTANDCYDTNLDLNLEGHAARINVSSLPSNANSLQMSTRLEEIFSTSRLTEVPPDQFKTFCLNVVQNELKLCIGRKKIEDEFVTLCYNCHAPFRSQAHLCAHMYKKHHDLLSNKILTAQLVHLQKSYREIDSCNYMQNDTEQSISKTISQQKNNNSFLVSSTSGECLAENLTYQLTRSGSLIFDEALLQPNQSSVSDSSVYFGSI